MTGAGQLRTRLTLQVPVEIPDGQGGVARSYDDVADVWAQVTLLSSRDNVVAEADGASQRARIVVRSPLALTLQHRFIDGDQIFRIIGTRDDGAWIEIDAEMRLV